MVSRAALVSEMKVLHFKRNIDTTLDYQLPGAPKTQYRLQIIFRADHPVATLTEPYPLKGTSLEIAFGPLAKQVAYDYHLDPTKTIWIEHRLKESWTSPWSERVFTGWIHQYRQVAFELRRGKLDDPKWEHLTPAQVDDLMGQPMVHFIPKADPVAPGRPIRKSLPELARQNQAKRDAQLRQDMAKLRPHLKEMLDDQGKVKYGAKTLAAQILGVLPAGHGLNGRVNPALVALRQEHVLPKG